MSGQRHMRINWTSRVKLALAGAMVIAAMLACDGSGDIAPGINSAGVHSCEAGYHKGVLDNGAVWCFED